MATKESKLMKQEAGVMCLAALYAGALWTEYHLALLLGSSCFLLIAGSALFVFLHSVARRKDTSVLMAFASDERVKRRVFCGSSASTATSARLDMTDANRSRQDMSAHVAIKKGDCQPESQTAVSRVSHWIQNYVDQNPQTEAAREACSIIYGLKALRPRPAVDELLGLIGEIAKSDQGLEEITRQKAG